MSNEKYTWDVCEGDPIFYENGAVIDFDDVVDEMNRLSEENEMLKKEIKAKDEIIEMYYEMRDLK